MSNNIPKLRFPGFTGEWEEKKLGEVCSPITAPLKLQSTDYLKEGKYPIVDQSQSLICGWTNDQTGVIYDFPAIIFGDHTCTLKYVDFPFVQGADGVKILIAKNSIDSNFAYQAFLSNPVKQEGYKRHFSDFKEKVYMFPTLPEQEKIAGFLTEMDNLIAAQGEKVEALKEKKKGLIQQLFPQPGQTTPHLRFPGFTGEWEEPSINEVFEIRNGYTPSKQVPEYWIGGTIPWFRMEDIRENGGILEDAIQHITPQGVKGSGLFKKNSIILATTATIGEHAMLIADSLANQQFTNFSIRESLANKYSPYFVYYSFFGIDEWCKRNTNAGGLLSVNIPALLKQPFLSPSLPEQEKIAGFLTEMDNLIASESEKLESLKSHKKGLMQQLFPQPEK